MKLEEKVIWLFKTKLSGLRNYDGKDLAISFQSQITVLLLQFTLPLFACLLERARLQSFIVIGTSPLSQSVNSGEWEKAVSTQRINESMVFYLRVFLVQTGAAHLAGRHSHEL